MAASEPYNHQDHPSSGNESSNWLELRNLLTGPEQRQLARILRRLDDPMLRAEEVSRALPDAISLGISRDKRIARAMQPTIDTALKSSVDKNPKIIADAIYPALGPAIRKAISATLMGMVQSLNHILNQSFSLQGIKWRIEAMRTQKSFAEVVLLHTLVYRVEQIYLIHRHTGVLLMHVSAEQVEYRDPDLISGMLTAIQDFVKDSFDSESGEMLDTLRMDGDHSVWIEHGPDAIMAAVFRGTPPVELRTRFRDILERVHESFGTRLTDFDGQTEPFGLIKPELEEALTSQVRDTRRTVSPLLWVLAAVVLLPFMLWGWQVYTNHRHLQTLLSQLGREPGIVITATEKRNGQLMITGLKDPMVQHVDQWIKDSKVDPADVRFHWQPFIALDNASVQKRAHSILDPPSTVQLEIKDDTMIASGSAPHRWIKRFRQQAAAVDGISNYDDSRLQDDEMMQLVSAIAALEQQSVNFKKGESILYPNQKESLMTVVSILKEMQRLYRSMEETVHVTIIGQADASGRQAYNLQISQRRADAVLGFLTNHGIDPYYIRTLGTGAKSRLKTLQKRETRDIYRSVTFKAFIEAN
jgi:OOP family OmpA-OmpF porin